MKRELRLAILSLALVIACEASAQSTHWAISLQLPKETYIQGERIPLAVKIENTGAAPAAYPGMAGRFYLDQNPVPCQARDVPLADAPPPLPGAPASVAPPAPMELPGSTHSSEINVGYWCNIEIGDAKALGWHSVCFRATSGADLAPKECCVRFEIVRPQGEDLEAFNHFGPKLRDVYHDSSLVNADLVKQHPTSVYAGYALAHQSAGFSARPLVCLDDPEGMFLPSEKTAAVDAGAMRAYARQQIAEAQPAMKAYAHAAAQFLLAHPDFAGAPLIRHQYAMCLAFTGRLPEALDQVKILAQGEGKEADEAKAYLAAKEKKATKHPCKADNPLQKQETPSGSVKDTRGKE